MLVPMLDPYIWAPNYHETVFAVLSVYTSNGTNPKTPCPVVRAILLQYD